MEDIFEKSIKAMDNVDALENGSNENPTPRRPSDTKDPVKPGRQKPTSVPNKSCSMS